MMYIKNVLRWKKYGLGLPNCTESGPISNELIISTLICIICFVGSWWFSIYICPFSVFHISALYQQQALFRVHHCWCTIAYNSMRLMRTVTASRQVVCRHPHCHGSLGRLLMSSYRRLMDENLRRATYHTFV